MAAVKIYTTRTCVYCEAAKRLLAQKGLIYEEIDVSSDAEARTWLRDVTGQTTVPQIFVDDRPCGGYSDIAALDRDGELDRILAGTAVQE